MNKEIINLAQLVDLEKYPDNILEEVCESLKKIFDANDIYYHKSVIKGNRKGFYLPVIVNGRNIGYYEIIGIKNNLTKEEINVVVALLLQIDTKLKELDNVSNDDLNVLRSINDFDNYQGGLNSNDISKITCLFIRVFDYNDVFISHGEVLAKKLMKIVNDNVMEHFNLDCDTVFQYTDNQIVIFTTNQTNGFSSMRANDLKDSLNKLDINIKFGLASCDDITDIFDLIVLAEHNMYFPVRKTQCI